MKVGGRGGDHGRWGRCDRPNGALASQRDCSTCLRALGDGVISLSAPTEN
jgi:hypothetical protein